MRRTFLAAVGVAALALGGAALAQSHQGGPVDQTASLNPSRIPGSHQGGPLGLNHGASVKPLPPAEEAAAEARMSPHAWCTSSVEPSRCRANAEREHASCMSTSPDHYEACRFALDKMHN